MTRFPNTLNTGSTEMRSSGATRRRENSQFLDRLAPTIRDLTLAILFDEEHTANWFGSHKSTMGNAAGVDRVQLRDLTHAPAINASGQVIRAIHRGDFRPNELRQVAIPRPDGRVRILHVATIAERIAFGAANERLTRRLAPLLGDNFHCPVPGKGVSTLLREVVRQIENSNPTQGLFVCEMDIERAFDNVNLQFLLDTLRSMGMQQPVVEVLARILNPTEAQGQFIGIPQGNPFSPILFAAILNRVLSADSNPEIGGGFLTPLVYADNLTYITQQEQVVETTIQRHVSQLAQANLRFGTAITTANIRDGETGTVVGNSIRMVNNQVRFEIPDDRMERAVGHLRQLATFANPSEAARSYFNGYVASKGHVYETAGREYCEEILARMMQETELGTRDLESILTRWEAAGQQWRQNPGNTGIDLNTVDVSLSDLLWDQDQETGEQSPPW